MGGRLEQRRLSRARGTGKLPSVKETSWRGLLQVQESAPHCARERKRRAGVRQWYAVRKKCRPENAPGEKKKKWPSGELLPRSGRDRAEGLSSSRGKEGEDLAGLAEPLEGACLNTLPSRERRKPECPKGGGGEKILGSPKRRKKIGSARSQPKVPLGKSKEGPLDGNRKRRGGKGKERNADKRFLPGSLSRERSRRTGRSMAKDDLTNNNVRRIALARGPSDQKQERKPQTGKKVGPQPSRTEEKKKESFVFLEWLFKLVDGPGQKKTRELESRRVGEPLERRTRSLATSWEFR